ncbi:hypothetical protein [Ruegeria faecimaris]|uniref:hypothetical protein n=1 Tax=Ruegeria faecimaris TaxID=686389 RepID=UPI00232FABA3|nr:hypothetical protein [Ruegeria faecimaris]
MNFETYQPVVTPVPPVIPVDVREVQIIQASQAASAAFEKLSATALFEVDTVTDTQKRILAIFRWYFLAAYCTRMLSGATHRLDHLTMQVGMDVYSAVGMILSRDEIEYSRNLIEKMPDSAADARMKAIGARGHKAGWIAANQYKQGRGMPLEIKVALSGALAAVDRLN